MYSLLIRIKRLVPKAHLFAALTCSILLAVLLLLPSKEVSATRSEVIQLEITSSQQDTTEDRTEVVSEDSQLAFLEKEPNAHQEDQIDSTDDALEQDTQTAEVTEAWQDFKVERGDNLTTIFKRAGLSSKEAYLISKATAHQKSLTKIFPGQQISFIIEDSKLKKLKLVKSELESLVISRLEDDQYETQVSTRMPEIENRYAGGSIENSLYADANAAGVSDRLIMLMAGIFGWDIDFSQDLHKGDQFAVLYEEKYLDGRKIGEGDILAAQFIVQNQTYTALRYEDSQGRVNYFTPEGGSMRKAFLRMPVDFARISSRFNPSRKHPVLNKIRAHKGVDYAAKTGTPIKASGDGKIIWRGTKGGYGRTVILQHGGNVTTLYAHMSRYKKGLSVGSRVRQGDVIGYIGQSGLASGPHLHYEFRIAGVHKNPMTVKLPVAAPISGKELVAFKKQAGQLMGQLETYQATQVASAGAHKEG